MDDIEVLKDELEQLRLRVADLNDFIEQGALPLHWVNRHGLIIWANKAELDMLGYTAEEYIGQPIGRFHAEEPIIDDLLKRLSADETITDYRSQLICKNGEIKHVLINSNVKREGGEFVHTRCFTRDVTPFVEEETRKNDFMAMVSHELKTPLTSMKSYLQVLLEIAKKEGSTFQLNALTRAEIQAQKMTAMIQDFLNLARLEGGGIGLNKSIFDLQQLAEEVAGDAPFLTTSHQVNVVGCENIALEADRDKISQVLNNLLTNAIKYSPKGGPITIGCVKEKGKVKIFVQDEGVGISMEDQERLFERFYRSRDQRIKTISGFGIGLYLVSEFLRYHNSQIAVESAPGAGSTFYFLMDYINIP